MKRSLITASLGLASLAVPAFAVDFIVNPGCAVNGNGTGTTCATTAGGVGPGNSLVAAVQNNANIGKTIRIMAGTWTERFRITIPNITIEPYGNGNVTLTGSTGIADPSGKNAIIYMANAGSLGYVQNLHDITIRSKPNSASKLRLIGNVSHSQSGIIAYNNKGQADNANLTIQGLEISSVDVGYFVEGNNTRILDNTITNFVSSGGWLWYSLGFTVANNTMSGQTGTGNRDCLTFQSADRGLIEHNTCIGPGYDGIDLGAQTGAEGMTRTLVRYNLVKNSPAGVGYENDLHPFSSVSPQGGVVYAYNIAAANNNTNKAIGAFVPYEYLPNPPYDYKPTVPVVEYWNNTIPSNNFYGFNADTGSNTNPATGLLYADLRFTLANNINKATRITTSIPTANMFVNSSNVTNTVFVNEVGGNYSLPATDTTAINKGIFMLRTNANTNTALVSVKGSPQNYFRAGDPVEFQGIGKRTVISVSPGVIQVDSPITTPLNAGIHYPYCGTGPDRGAVEFCPAGETP